MDNYTNENTNDKSFTFGMVLGAVGTIAIAIILSSIILAAKVTIEKKYFEGDKIEFIRSE